MVYSFSGSDRELFTMLCSVPAGMTAAEPSPSSCS